MKVYVLISRCESDLGTPGVYSIRITQRELYTKILKSSLS